MKDRLFNIAIWTGAIALLVFALTSLAPAQEYNDESLESRMARATQEMLAKLDQRVTTIEGQVKELQEKVTGLESRLPTRPAPSPVTAPAVANASVKIHEADLPWQAKPTPMAEVVRIVQQLRPQPHETFVDFGCGFDARYVIEAVHRYGCRGIGVEIDPARAASAREYVREAGLSDRIQIIEADARTVDVKADVGVVYLEPEMLEQVRPQLEKLDRFVSYQHYVPGLTMTKGQDTFYWRRTVPVVAQARTVIAGNGKAVWNGQLYSQPLCSSPTCAMCNSIRAQLRSSASQTFSPPITQPAKQQAGVTITRSDSPSVPLPSVHYQQRTYSMNCVGGRCFRPQRSRWRN